MRLPFVISIVAAVGAQKCGPALPCPIGQQGLYVAQQDSRAVVSNGFACASVQCGKLAIARADFSGAGRWGNNILADGGVTLQSEGATGRIQSSASQTAADVEVKIVANSSSIVALRVLGVATGSISGGMAPAAAENWTISLYQEARSLDWTADGTTLLSSSLRAVRRQWELQPTSVYGLYSKGVVQMKGAPGGKDFYPSADDLTRVYALGGSGAEAAAVGNASIDIISKDSAIKQTVLMSSSSGNPYWSGLQQVYAGGLPAKDLDGWMLGWQGAPASDVPAGQTWSSVMSVGLNSLDFPVLTLPFNEKAGAGAGAVPPQRDIHAMLMGVYASPVGNLCTHTNEVAPGQAVGQIATTIARPDRGYTNTYNYFDPDNYLSTAAMLWSNDPYLYEQVRRVIERSGEFLLPSGQLPHHFVGTKPVYQALSGEIQTGPNVFWILSALNYAQTSQNMTWLGGYMPKLRLASEFLFGLIDEDVGMATVPGSLMIDVFIRNNFTSDTNAMLVGFFDQFAVAEEYVGNATGATKLRQLARTVSASMNEHLWASEEAGADHYITQWDGPVLQTTRDFVDYDSNLIAAAHGVSSLNRTNAIFKRIDGGRCRPSQTFVSEKWYGPGDTTKGNVGDSWTAMGRIAWFESLARQNARDEDGFNSVLLQPLQDQLLNHTWMHERQFCDGTQQPNRTWAYFEYPSVVQMLLRHVKYGVQQGIGTFVVDPLGPTAFNYSIGQVQVTYSPDSVVIAAPRPNGNDPTLNVSVMGLPPGTKYQLSSTPRSNEDELRGTRASGASFQNVREYLGFDGHGSGGECSVVQATATTDSSGVLRFQSPLGIGCLTTASKTGLLTE